MAAPTDLQRFARRAILIRAKADDDLTALVPAASIDPDGTPEWPFILAEAPRSPGRIFAACVRGAQVNLDLHAFARAREVGGQTVETSYDHISRIGAQIETTFADNRLVLENGAICRIRLSDMNLLKDGEPDAWHWFAQANCRVLAA